ncbi:response regulator transcription factor [Galactobacter valiniphilus]|uniref:response regulator transcription factor n=1 Tax=Galactobacter valiniphilus TaxID=2676122 RepID=UPI001F2670BE|nr:response regulator transcription factor [Galactobacter valiniphilus]
MIGEGQARLHVVHVEDDDVIREATALGLERIGYDVHGEADGLEGLEYLRTHPADVVLLDVMLPGISGAALCRRLREFSRVPVIMLSARHDNVDVVAGLDAGADDYVAKPVSLDVLDARIRALLRRSGATTGRAEGPDTLASGGVGGADIAAQGTSTAEAIGPDLLMDREALQLTLRGEPIHLTPTEWRLLILLVQERGRLVTREHLLREAWEDAWAGDTRLVDVHVQRLRRKVGGERITTVRGFGYRWHD